MYVCLVYIHINTFRLRANDHSNTQTNTSAPARAPHTVTHVPICVTSNCAIFKRLKEQAGKRHRNELREREGAAG